MQHHSEKKNGREHGGTIVLSYSPYKSRLYNNLKRGYVTDAYGLGTRPCAHQVTAYIYTDIYIIRR